MPATTAFLDASILDCAGRDPYKGVLLVEGRRIKKLGSASQVFIPRDARKIDLAGKTLMPGLMDAHAHVGLVDYHGSMEAKYPGSTYAFTVARNIADYLDSGFTTIRDAGGCAWSFKESVRRGLIRGPRMFISNGFISQTGGHGDSRPHHHLGPPQHDHPLAPPPFIADGPDAVRRAARENLRQGADQIKVMAGGGAASPTDSLDVPQYTIDELAAAVYEAKAVRKYVMAHVYVPQGIMNCAQAGVLSIEHGNFLDEESASMMKERGMFLVPTLVIYDLIAKAGAKLGSPAATVEKIKQVKVVGSQSIEVAIAAGVKIASGSDVFGAYAGNHAAELELKASVMGNMGAIMASTRVNAELFGILNDTGALEAGKLADLIVVRGDPLADIRILQDSSRVQLVMLEGNIAKDTLESS
ncbi:MAG: amidohydrolase family protein [SAR202 cluster bacterium]|nr:amidohydrolase family protein [SAR202 cluster bacterium]